MLEGKFQLNKQDQKHYQVRHLPQERYVQELLREKGKEIPVPFLG